MLKYGLLIFGGILVIVCIWEWFVDIYVPRRMIANAVEITANQSTRCNIEDESIESDANLSQVVESIDNLRCRFFTLSDGQIEICHSDFVSSRQNTEDVPLKQNQLKIRFLSRRHDVDTSSIIDIGDNRITASFRDVAVSFSNTHIFVGWIRRQDTTKQDAITLRVIEIRTGKQRLEKEIYYKACCLVNLTLRYDPKRDKLLLAWNDWSNPDNRNLFFGGLDVNQLLQGNPLFVPKQPVFKDKWDKRNPYFLCDNDKIYLIYTTGDRWGLLAYSGRQSIGICTMEEINQAKGYYFISAEKPLGKVLKIENGLLWYEVLSQDASRIEEIRKIKLNKAFKVL